jgi:hypothetical protein
MGDTGTDTCSLEGDGAITEGTCAGGNLSLRGNFKQNSISNITVTTDDDTTNTVAILLDTGTTLDDHLTDIKGTSFVKDTHSLIDIETYVDILDDATSGNVKIAQDAAAVLVDTGTTLPALIDDLAVKKNATFSNFEFLMVLTSDHVTPATGLTVTGERSIDGAAFAAVGGTIAEVSNGIYQFDALAADTNGDVITWRFSSATADDTFVTFKTVA